MEPGRISELARRLLRPLIDDSMIEAIDVREDEDWSGTPSLFVDVFVSPGKPRPDAESWTRLKRSLSQELLDGGEQRFPYIRLRDRAAEDEEAA
jgi:hypothetical protein